MDLQVNYTFEIHTDYEIDKVYEQIETTLLNLDYKIIFMAYSNTEIKVTFKETLTDNEEIVLFNILLKYLV